MIKLKEKLQSQLVDAPPVGSNKITIVGAGQVGMACAICILAKKVSNEICIIDRDEERVQGEVIDLQHGSNFVQNAKITGGSDFSLTVGSRIYIITAGVRGSAEETRLALLERNAAIVQNIIPKIVETSPSSVILMVSNPVDVLTYLAWKLSGFPRHRVIGSGTTLDSARFRYVISRELNVAVSSCEAYVIGEHGDSAVPVWSAVSVSGVSLRGIDGSATKDEDVWNEVNREVIDAGNEVMKRKGYTNWAVALSCTAIAEAILKNTGEVMPVSTGVMGMHGIEKDVFLSLPCTLNANGITSIVKLNLTPQEIKLLHKSAETLFEYQNSLDITKLKK